MADQDMRLRLVVRRHGLPELRLMWHVRLDSNPTISKLLEHLNSHVPLESDHWGLEDYVVELRDSDGTDFECLHYQLVRSVLKPDDRVFIRALDKDDHRRRRISGRDQITSDGRHLIDGIPFGRPHLRASTGRPNVRIPPRKRARFAYSQRDGEDSDRYPGEKPTSPVLLLTNGEQQAGGHRGIATSFDDADSDADDSDFTDNDESDSASNISQQETEDGDTNTDTDTEMERGAGENSEAEAQEDLDEEARDLAMENATIEGQSPTAIEAISLATLDKLTALTTAFPTAPLDMCEKVLAASEGDLRTTHRVLCKAFNSKMSEKALVAWKPGSSNEGLGPRQIIPPINSASTSPRGIVSGSSLRKRKLQDQFDIEYSNDDNDDDDDDDGEDVGHNISLQRKYDHAGFPPGTITSGKGLAHMAAISASFDGGKTNAASETTSTTLKVPIEELVEEDNVTSNSGSSSSSSTSSDDSDDESDENSFNRDSSSQSSSTDSNDSDSQRSDNSSEGPRRLTPKHGRALESPTSDSDTSDSESESESDSESDSESESDDGPEEYPSKSIKRISPTGTNKASDQSSESPDDTSESESTTTNSTSHSERDAEVEPHRSRIPAADAVALPPPNLSSPHPKQKGTAPVPVPPGAGKESTRRRNARRRAAKLAKKEMPKPHADSADSAQVEGQHASNNEAALFEAKRKALLDALATGGIEVGPSGETILNRNLVETGELNQMRNNNGSDNLQQYSHKTAAETSNNLPGDNEESASQTRHRINLGVSRRLVFGALGLRNPKSKEDEDKLRDQLQAKVQLRGSQQLSAQPPSMANEATKGASEEDLNSWRLKINYRAVECCDDSIQLSSAPFPFQQRWDPQQQNSRHSKRNKRGGQGKQAQRNQAHFYEDDSRPSKKRKQYYDGPCDEENTTANDTDVINLNYDDIDSQDRDYNNGNNNNNSNVANNTSQATDLDDLPSLPQDVSVLPILRPGEAQVGMVICWQKWSCSSATSWQPQLSRVTAIVAAIGTDETSLDVYLAKRDRHLDGNEKRFDDKTGRRIYDKFEAPDLYEEQIDDYDDSGADEGYRTVSWADMQDPRVLQQPLDATVGSEATSKCIVSIETDQTELTGLGPEQTISEEIISDIHNHNPNTSPKERQEDCIVESPVQAASNSISYQFGQNQQKTDSATSDVSQISSPSRQLHETSSQAARSHLPAQNLAGLSSIERAESPWPNTSSSIPLLRTISTSPQLEGDFESDVMAGTPRATLPPTIIPSSVNNVDSGQQPDYTVDVDGHVSDPFDPADGIDSRQNSHPASACSSTPPPVHRTVTPDDAARTGKKTPPLASNSLSSPNSIWCTAFTSHSTRSPSKVYTSPATSKSGPKVSGSAFNPNHNETIYVPDEQPDHINDYESSPPASSSIDVKEEVLTQLPARTLDAISPPPRRRQSRRVTTPPRVQVIELSSDSEPAYTENYADDDIDSNYSPRSNSLPEGEGWVKKREYRKARRSVV